MASNDIVYKNYSNVCFGNDCLPAFKGSTDNAGYSNIIIGYAVRNEETTGMYNVAIGNKPLFITPKDYELRGRPPRVYTKIVPYQHSKYLDLMESIQVPKVNQGAEILLIVAVFILCFILIINARTRHQHQEEE